MYHSNGYKSFYPSATQIHILCHKYQLLYLIMIALKGMTPWLSLVVKHQVKLGFFHFFMYKAIFSFLHKHSIVLVLKTSVQRLHWPFFPNALCFFKYCCALVIVSSLNNAKLVIKYSVSMMLSDSLVWLVLSITRYRYIIHRSRTAQHGNLNCFHSFGQKILVQHHVISQPISTLFTVAPMHGQEGKSKWENLVRNSFVASHWIALQETQL